MASYVAAYRIGMLISTAGVLFLVSGFESAGFGLTRHGCGLCRDGDLVLIGTITGAGGDRTRTVRARGGHDPRGTAFVRVMHAAVGAFSEFLARSDAWAALAFVVLFKFTDAFSGTMTAPFVIDLGFTRNDYAAIVKGVGLPPR